MPGNDRRGFLRQLARDVARTAVELDSTMRTRTEGREALAPELVDPDAGHVPVEPTARAATVEELRQLCRELGLDELADVAAASALRSIRLTPAEGGARTRLCGSPSLPPGLEWPTWRGEPLDLLLQVDLTELPPSSLPSGGTLLVFFSLAEVPAGVLPEDAGACRVVHVDQRELAVTAGRPGLALVSSVELMLPPEPPAAHEHSFGYAEWTELRERLSAIQGVALEDSQIDHRSTHRLLGHPDSLAPPMAPDAALLARGSAVADRLDESPDVDAAGWRLLVQLSPDASAGLDLPADERLFVWIDDQDLQAHRFHRVRAFVR